MSNHKLTREQKEKAVEIAIQGGDPLVYLKLCGAKNPTAAWWYIKKTLATKNPQLLEKIPEKIGTVLNEKGQVAARVEIAEKLPTEAVAEVPEADPLAGFVAYDPGAPEGDKTAAMSREEHKEAHKGSAAITVPVNNYDGFRVSAIEGELGTYSMEIVHFKADCGKQQIYILAEDLGPFINELKRAAQILGVDV